MKYEVYNQNNVDEDTIFDVIIAGPYPDLDMSDIPGINHGNEERSAAVKNIIERFELTLINS